MNLEVNPEVFGAYAFYSAIMVAKVLMMALLTARHRLTKKIFANPEDAAMDPKHSKIKFDDPDVERVRRAHLNDLENILPFFTIGLLYCFTNPAVGTAKLLFRIFAASRIMHTIVYAIVPLPQPSRALAFFGGVGVNLCMIYKVISHFA